MQTILQHSRRPDVSFYPSGRIDITARAARAIDLHEGDVIDIAFDNSDYKLFVKHRAGTIGRHEATVHATKNGSHNFRCYSKTLTGHILQRFTDDPLHDSLRVPAGRIIHNEYYGPMISIITKYNIQP